MACVRQRGRGNGWFRSTHRDHSADESYDEGCAANLHKQLKLNAHPAFKHHEDKAHAANQLNRVVERREIEHIRSEHNACENLSHELSLKGGKEATKGVNDEKKNGSLSKAEEHVIQRGLCHAAVGGVHAEPTADKEGMGKKGRG